MIPRSFVSSSQVQEAFSWLSMPMRTRRAPRRRIVPFPIRLEPSKRARLEVLAKADRRSLSNYILKVLYDHIDAIGTSRDKPGK